MTDEKRNDQGIRRKVIFQAHCGRCFMGYEGPERDMKSIAAFDLAVHNMDVHGGNPRQGEQ